MMLAKRALKIMFWMKVKMAACVVLAAAAVSTGVPLALSAKERPKPPANPAFLAELRQLPRRIAYSKQVNDQWDLFLAKCDGSDPVNLTQTPNLDESPGPDYPG